MPYRGQASHRVGRFPRSGVSARTIPTCSGVIIVVKPGPRASVDVVAFGLYTFMNFSGLRTKRRGNQLIVFYPYDVLYT